MPRDLSRRGFVGALAPLTLTLAGIRKAFAGAKPGRGRLRARPGRATEAIVPGLSSLGFDSPRDAQLYVPTGYQASRPAGMILGLHGASQNSQTTLRILKDAAEAHDYVLLAPDSRGITWDLMRGEFGADETFIDRALTWTFARCAIDPSRLVIAGFSDGATAALSLGLINGDLFTRVIAFSPGFIVGEERHGRPPIFISHGTQDQILPIDRTSRLIVPTLRGRGYAVEFREFDGPHTVPPDIVEAAMSWLG